MTEDYKMSEKSKSVKCENLGTSKRRDRKVTSSDAALDKKQLESTEV